jgi:hypothetical protein
MNYPRARMQFQSDRQAAQSFYRDFTVAHYEREGLKAQLESIRDIVDTMPPKAQEWAVKIRLILEDGIKSE